MSELPMRFLGLYDARSGLLTPIRRWRGRHDPRPLGAARRRGGSYVICGVAGLVPEGSQAWGGPLGIGDWLVSDGRQWVPVTIVEDQEAARGLRDG